MHTPKDGDFASWLEEKETLKNTASQSEEARVESDGPEELLSQRNDSAAQSIEDVLLRGEEPTEELLEELYALENAAELSDEELARQALSDPGADGDTQTPE